MSKSNNDATRNADPSDSILMSLARAAIADNSAADLSWPALDLEDPQQREFGDYELLEEIGRGGMGVVYRARQCSLDRDVAIKFIAAGFADSINVARFLGEARAAARLMHPNIVPVHEVGSIDSVHYFSMPLIKGRSLALLLDEQRMPVAAVIVLMLKLCEAIDYAHRLGLLHLDLKPANVLLDSRDEPLIADFGLARHMDGNGGVDAQEVSGTPSFMAPEQILIKQYRLTPATDIYALGALLYRCLTGVSPHGVGSPDELIRSAAAGRIRAPRELDPTISRDLAAICMKCLELQPKDRYASAAELADELRRVRDGLPVKVRPIGAFERMRRWFQREPKFAMAVTATAFTLLIGAATTTWQWQEASAQRDVAKAERDRTTLASETGAFLFSYEGTERARDLIEWLRTRLPNDEERQADALAAFASAVGSEKHDGAEELLVKVMDVLGADYRRQMIQALQAGTDAYRDVYAAMLAWRDSKNADAAEIFAASLQSAIKAHANDPFVWQVAAVYCVETDQAPRCLYPQAAETLVRMAPDNMYHWLLLLITEGPRAREALHEAARSAHFDDYGGANLLAFSRAIEVAAVPAPTLIARPAQILAPLERPEASIAKLEAYQVPMLNWSKLLRYCGAAAESAPNEDQELRADCLAVGERLMRSSGGLLSRMIGVALVRNLAKGTPLAEEAKQIRRLYTYLVSTDEKLSPGQRMSYETARYLADITGVGEMVAFQRRVEFFGMPGEPPANWQPDDPSSLFSGKERIDNMIAKNAEASRLMAEGKHAEAVELMLAIEAGTRRFLKDTNAWRVPRFLMNLGKARMALGRYPAARTNLLEAWELTRSYGPPFKDARGCAQTLADLYSAWSLTEKDQGYDLEAGRWKQTQAQLIVASEE